MRSLSPRKFARLMSNRKLNQAGMTLIEIMIVLAIVGGLMAVMGSRFIGQLDKSRVSNAKIQMKEIQKQLDLYNTDCGGYPTTEQGLQALMQNPGEDVCANWGPESYMKKEPKDPWGRPFLYESDGATVSLKSLGKDRKEGGDGFDKDLNLDEI